MNTHTRTPDPTGSPSPHGAPDSASSHDSTPSAEPGLGQTPSRVDRSILEPTVAEHDSPSPATGSPRTVGKYVILDEVQAGGMGVVYQARDPELNRTVALKMIKAGHLATAEEVARFRLEAQAAARLDHPHIVPVYEIGQHEGCLYFTMAFAAGGSLAQHQGRFVADPRAAVALLEKVARAVHCAHRRNILHRDLKPANILLDEHGNPWVSDFGLAKLVDASLDLTQPGQAIGTPAYMAPEQASGATDRLSPRTDVWALGVILYELLTGQRPFTGKTREERVRQVLTADPPPPRAGGRPLDRGLEAVVLKCLEKAPSRRYASAEDLADDLGRWLRGEPVLARPPSWPVRTWRTARRWRPLAVRLAVAAALLALLALAWRGWSLSRPQEEPEDPRQQEALRTLLDRMHQGKPLTLIPDSGGPAWSRWQPRRGDARTSLDRDGVFRVEAGKQVALLELLPDAPRRYVLRARVQHCDSRPSGEVGIYFAHGKVGAKGGTVHWLFRLAFNDRVLAGVQANPGGPLENEVRLTLPLFWDRAGTFRQHLPDSCSAGRFVPAGEAGPMPWRQLTVKVTPEWIWTSWEGKNLQACNPNDALDFASRTLANEVVKTEGRPAEWAITDADLAPGKGIGLYVDQGAAAFQSVEIEPLPQE